MRNIRRVGRHDIDPLDGVANFFDLGVIFALAFMVPLLALTARPNGQAPDKPATAGRPTAAARVDHWVHLKNYHVSKDQLSGQGERLGVAYRLKSGEVVYVPETER